MSNSWSYSMFSSAVKCLRHYKLAYIDKIEVKHDSGDLLFGSALHSALNALVSEKEKDDAQQIFQIYWEPYQNREIAWGRFNWSELAELGKRFLNNFERLHAKRYKAEVTETRLYAEYKGVKLEGTLDFYGEYDGVRSLRDFKTSGYAYPKEKREAALQLNLYAYLATASGLPNPDRLGYTVFCKGTGSIQDLTWEFNEAKMYEALDSLVSYCKMLEKNEEHPANLNSCVINKYLCQYYNICHPPV